MKEIRKLKADEIELRVGRVVKTAKGSGVTLLLYKNARVDMAILDELFTPFGWTRKHEVVNGNMYCTVSVYDRETGQWVSKQDCGTESHTEGEKGEASDSFKRACVNWGIGRELYTAPDVFVPCELDGRDRPKGNPDWRVDDIEYGAAGEIVALKVAECATGEKRVVFEWRQNANDKQKGKGHARVQGEKGVMIGGENQTENRAKNPRGKSAYARLRALLNGSEYTLDDVNRFILENFGEERKINDLSETQFKRVYAAYYKSIYGEVWDGKTYRP